MKSRSSCGHLAQAMVMVWLLHASTLLLSSTNGQEYDSSYEEHLNFSDVFTDIAEDLTTGYSHGGPETIHTAFRSHCQACQFRNVYAMASLKSIQAHVLMKLGIDSMPNRTQYPKIPRHILESFTRQEGVPLHSPSMVRDTDYMADEPSAGVEEIEEDFDYYPITNKIYILAKQAPEQDRRPLGDRKQYLQFKLETRDFTGDLHAKLMVYVRGEEWLKSNSIRADGGVAGSADKLDKREVIFTVGRTGKAGGVLERFQRTVPKGLGDFVEFNVTDLVLEWFKERDQGTVRTSKYIAVETLNELAALLVVNSPTDSQFIPYIEIEFRDAPKKRIKRNLSLNCDENANETRCCRYPLTVDFEKFGWDWIIAPKRYEAWYCAGECMISFLPKYEHTHVMQLSTSAIPCCSPKKMNSIRLLYFDMSYNVIYSTIPNMVVEKCSCS